MEFGQSGIQAYLQTSVIMSFVLSFSGGLVASFTPCVYPMIPITASFVGASNLGGSKLKGFILSLTYILGVAVTYSALGMIAALTGRMFGEIGSSPWTYFIVANIFIILALGMLDVIPIPMFAPKTTTEPSGIIGVFLVGIASGFVVGPCTAPVLAGLLSYVATTGSVVFGASLLFVFALGLGVLPLLVGTFSGLLAVLPGSGEWMVTIKKILGLIMIALAEYFLIKSGELML